MAAKGDERRREDRAPVQLPVLYHVADGVEERVSATLNLSLSGLRFPSRRQLATRDRLLMRLLIPGEIRPVVLHGIVRWVSERGESGSHHDVGVAFERAESETIETLKRFLSR